MEIDQVKIAIGAILIIAIGTGILSYLSGNVPDIGTVSVAIAAIAGLAGYDGLKKE